MLGVCNREVSLEKNLYDAQSGIDSAISIDNLEDSILFASSRKVVVEGGHYWVRADDPEYVGVNPNITWDLACQTVSALRNKGVDSYVSLLMNDLALSIEERAAVKENYSLPKSYIATLERHGLCEDDIIKCGGSVKSSAYGNIHWEGHLLHRFDNNSGFRKRHWCQEKEQIKGKCVKAVIEYIKDLRDQGADRLVLILPGCCYDNAVKAVNYAKRAFPEISAYYIWHTGNCTK